MSSLKNKVIWITGASSGIGRALAVACAEGGARLVLSARRKEKLEEVKAQLRAPREEILVLPLDLAKAEEMTEKVQVVMSHFGRIDWLINNGGISQRSLIMDTGMEVYRRMVEVNYIGTVALSKAVLPVFIQQQSGHFGVVTSLMGKFASPMRSGYCGAKHALHGFFDALRLEHEDDGVRVTMVCPGFIHTDISMNALTGDGSPQQQMDKATESGMSPDECARQIIRAMQRGKMEVYIGGKETFAIYLKRWFPAILHRIVKRSAVT